MFVLSIRSNSGYAASAARQISGMVAVAPPNFPFLNCWFDFLSEFDPADHHRCGSEALPPSIGASRCFARRWSCSMVWFRYLLLRTRGNALLWQLAVLFQIRHGAGEFASDRLKRISSSESVAPLSLSA